MTKHFIALRVWVSVKVCDRERNQPIRIHGTVSSPNIIENWDEGGSITQVRWSFGAFADTFNIKCHGKLCWQSGCPVYTIIHIKYTSTQNNYLPSKKLVTKTGIDSHAKLKSRQNTKNMEYVFIKCFLCPSIEDEGGVSFLNSWYL